MVDKQPIDLTVLSSGKNLKPGLQLFVKLRICALECIAYINEIEQSLKTNTIFLIQIFSSNNVHICAYTFA